MKDRIVMLIECEELTRVQFAQKVGVNLCSLMHILTGRNKPSLDMVSKILSIFPKLNPDWLIFGKGLMYQQETDSWQSSLFAYENNNTKQRPTKTIIDHNSNTYYEVFDKPDDIEKKTKVFISYSWDTDEHKEWVKCLADKLKEKFQNVILDQYDLKAGMDKMTFMTQSVQNSDKVLIVLTPEYKKKIDEKKGGVNDEYFLIHSEISKDKNSTKFIPIIRQGKADEVIPDNFNKDIIYIEMQKEEDFERKFVELELAIKI